MEWKILGFLALLPGHPKGFDGGRSDDVVDVVVDVPCAVDVGDGEPGRVSRSEQEAARSEP